MNRIKDKINRFLKKLKLRHLYIVAISSIFFYIISLYYFTILVLRIQKPFENVVSSIDTAPLLEKVFVSVLFAPLIETFFFQFLIIEITLLISFFAKRPVIGISLSSALFAATHNQSNYYIVYAFGIGLIFGFFYYILKFRKENAFIHTTLLHGMINFLILFPTLL